MFWEHWVLASFRVPGRQGSGRFRAHLAFEKVPGTLPWFRAARAWIVPKFWNHRNTNFETSCKPRVWGTRILARFEKHWVPTRFRDPPQMRTHSLDILPGLCHKFPTGTRSYFLARFPCSENNSGVGYTPWVVPRFMLRTGSQKTNLQGNQGSRTKRAGQRAIADREGDSVPINERVSVPETQGFNIRCGLRQSCGKERSRKTRFQGQKVPGTQEIPKIPQPILGALWRVPYMPIHVRLLSGCTASVD